VTVSKKAANQSAVKNAKADATETTIKVTRPVKTKDSDPVYEYSIDGGKTWQKSPTFKKDGKGNALKPGTEYSVMVRKAETEDSMPSKPVTVKVKTADKSPSGYLLAEAKAKGNKNLDITWLKVQNVDGYDIFLGQCGRGEASKCKKVKTIKGNKTFKWTKKGLKPKKPYKVFVKAFKVVKGKKEYVRTSPLVHAFTTGSTYKYTNSKSVTVNKTKVTLKKGGTFKLKAKVSKVKTNKTLITEKHAAKLRYYTTSKKIATVSKGGKSTAKARGSCTIYVIAVSGARKAIKVTVK